LTDGTEPTSCGSSSICSESDIGFEDRLGPVAVRFARDHPRLYDLIVFAVIPVVLLFLLFGFLRRFYKFVVGGDDPPRLTLLAAAAASVQ
jgi:hypothetical protein